MENADNGGIVWSDRKRIAFGLPWTFTKYTLTKEKLLIHTGMLNTQEDEVRLYRIMDVTAAPLAVGAYVRPWHHPIVARRISPRRSSISPG